MDKILTVARVVAPIFAAIALGMLARKKNILTREEVGGLQNFVIKFALPCVLFNSCLTARMGTEAMTSMGLVLLILLVSTLWSFRMGKKRFPRHNLPMIFCAQETGMLGIPLFMLLFGAEQAFRMGVLDLAQAMVACPVIAILTADAGKNPTVGEVAKKVLTSPLILMSLLGLSLNLTGLGQLLDGWGVGGILTETTGFLAQPVSSVMIFAVGYNFSLTGESRREIFRICAVRTAYFAAACLLVQGFLLLIPGVEPLTRWALFLYCALPASYLAPGLGRTKEDYAAASGVCSLLTVLTMAVFCIITVVMA